MIDSKNIHIGKLIETRWLELNISIQRTVNFFKCTEEEIFAMFQEKELKTETLLNWSKLLQYDFFRMYSQYLILYSPSTSTDYRKRESKTSSLPSFRKNLYTKDIIDFLMEQLASGEKTKLQIINDYKIPKTTLYKWIKKYNIKN
ncbi:hypothetical protein GCM10022217_26190 [Chryseobacterium ginsenosidimutans]|uniref:transposase n=1 Tax=Chryseobacterium ginsenosidimutans TaxID=687846 RepID=UPI0031E0F9E1